MMRSNYGPESYLSCSTMCWFLINCILIEQSVSIPLFALPSFGPVIAVLSIDYSICLTRVFSFSSLFKSTPSTYSLFPPSCLHTWFPLLMGRHISGGRVTFSQPWGCRFDPEHLWLCPWARDWTPSCSWFCISSRWMRTAITGSSYFHFPKKRTLGQPARHWNDIQRCCAL